MKAMMLVRPGFDRPLELQDRSVPQPGSGEAVVRLRAAALNHRDILVVRGLRPFGKSPFIPASDGAGVIEAVGPGVTAWKPGDEVVMNAGLYCGTCSYCLRGEHCLCEQFEIIGGPSDGTLAECIKLPARNLARKPAHLDFQQAAALPLALGTAWRALITQAALKPGETVLIHGIGGGVALFCLQIAIALGARAIVTSGSPRKLEWAAVKGAAAGIDYKREDVAKRVMAITGGEGAHVVVDSGGKETLPISLAAASKGGRIVHFGATTGMEATLNFRDLFWGQKSIIGSTMNTQAEFDAAIRFVTNTKLMPTVSGIYSLTEAEGALKAMEETAQFGKLVIAID